MKRSLRRRAAFTLIEVLLVIGILLVLGTVSVVAYTRVKASADKKSAQLLVNSTADAVKQYQAEMGSFPESDQGLNALITKPTEEELAKKWRPYLEAGTIPVDPWGSEVKYERVEDTGDTPGPGFRVWSVGPDKQDGTDDDIQWPQKREAT